MSPLKKITIILLASSLLAVMAQAFYLSRSLNDSVLEQWRDNTASSVEQLAQVIDSDLLEAQNRLQVVAGLPQFRSPLDPSLINRQLNGIPLGADKERRQALDWLLAEADHGFDVLFLLLPNGDHYISHPFSVQRSLKTYNLSHRPYFRKASESSKPVISDAFLGADEIPAVAIDVPILNELGEISAHLGGVFHLDGLTRLIEKPDMLHRGVTTFLLDRAGKLICQCADKAVNEALLRTSFVRSFFSSQPAAPTIGTYTVVSDLGKSEPQGEKIVSLVRLANGWILGIAADRGVVVSRFSEGIWKTTILDALLLFMISGIGILFSAVIGRRWQSAEWKLRDAHDLLEQRVVERTTELASKEERYRTTLRAIGDAVISLDIDGKIVGMNPVAERLTGQEIDKAGGKPLNTLLTLFNDQTQEWVKNIALEAFANREPKTFPSLILKTTEGGKSYPTSGSVAHILDDADRVTGVVLTLRDLTSERNLQSRTAKSEQQYRALFNAMAEGVCLHDLVYDTSDTVINYRIIAANPAYEEILKLPVADVLGRLATEAYAVAKAPFLDVYARVAESGEPQRFESYVPPMNKHFLISVVSPWRGSFVTVFEDITERKKAESLIIESEARYRSIVQSNAAVMIIVIDKYGQIVEWNSGAARSFGYSSADVIGQPLTMLMPERFRAVHKSGFAGAVIHQGRGYEGKTRELVGLRKDGQEFPLELTLGHWAQGDELFFSAIMLDISERRKTEAALHASQKLDAVGQMAGGIAHDFNNILAIILGNLFLLRRQLSGEEEKLARLSTIEKSSERAAELTKQLLGFARKRAENLAVVDINNLIQENENLFLRAVTPQITLVDGFAEDLWATEIDPGDFNDALINLVLNARDAMPAGGRLTFETRNVLLDSAFCSQNPGASAGEFVELTLSDTGEGISPELLEKIFEPFFSTKEDGKGTGLGLAMVFSFAKRSHGYIKVDSEPGEGTSFHLFLPRAKERDLPAEPGDPETAVLPRGKETVLVVDDEPFLLNVIKESLESLGYTVYTAYDGSEALARLADDPAIELMLSDVIMPGGMNGYDLKEKATMEHPNLKVLLTSGYVGKAGADARPSNVSKDMLRKPFSQKELACRVRTYLDQPVATHDVG